MNGISIVILLVSAIAAILAGMAVFANQRPPDPRMNQVLDEIDELKGLLNQLQKQVMQIERKLDKDLKDAKTEGRDAIERLVERVERKVNELAG